MKSVGLIAFFLAIFCVALPDLQADKNQKLAVLADFRKQFYNSNGTNQWLVDRVFADFPNLYTLTPSQIKTMLLSLMNIEQYKLIKQDNVNVPPYDRLQTLKNWTASYVPSLKTTGLVAGGVALTAGAGYWLYKKYHEYQANIMNVKFCEQFYDGKNNEMVDKVFYLWPELYAFSPSNCKKIMPVMLAVSHKMGMVIDTLGMNDPVTVKFGTLVRDLLINHQTVGFAKTATALDKLAKIQS